MSTGFAVTGPGPGAALLDAHCPDVYFTAGYGRAAAVADSGTWRTVHEDDRLMLPHVLRPVGETDFDAATPYGYSGLHVDAACTPADLARFWSRALGHWRESGVVALFLRFSPLDSASVEAVRGLGSVTLTRRADTITVDVSQGPDQVWKGMEGRSRTAIRKARSTGLSGALRPARAEDMLPGSPFRALYESTMARLGSQSWYLFPDRYYRQLAAGLDKALSIAEIRDPDDAVVAAALVLRHRDRAHYHLAGSDPQAARVGGNNLLVWTILEWAAHHGCRVVHLGGGVRADDGLFQFKRSFGGVRTPFWTGSAIVRPDRYRELVAAQAQLLGRSADDLAASGYFPAYRAGQP
ncbi:lipid II:glycine glycyltransferase FemX [Micromonospora sp. CPCC 205556]|uniref:lipid II:glycine glycyltransferase FemX n=1 Tax=Micromonospora sp. CPCC 205556 TaxID=3122398 RepID=UPI002FF14854